MLRDRIGGLCWMLVAVYFVVQPVVAAAWPVPYSWTDNTISDLGATSCTAQVCSPRHALMNAALVLTGVLVIVGGMLLWPRLRINRRTGVGLSFVLVGGLGTAVIGWFPFDVAYVLHALTAVVHIPLQAVGLVLLGSGSVRSRRAFGLFTIAAGAMSLVGVVLFFGGISTALGVGGAERLADYLFYAWVVLAGLVSVIRPRRQPLAGS